MPNYNWEDYQQFNWIHRYPAWVQGHLEWTAQQIGPQWTPPSLPGFQFQPLVRPRLFVSHRQIDVKEALQVAWLADQEGFEFWVDVLDPNLGRLQALLGIGVLSLRQTGAAIASVIEMGLINSTHVLAVITSNTQGSQWVPYEYGRVKNSGGPVSLQVGCWVDPGLTMPLPEYLHLGAVTRSETDLRTWLRNEFTNWAQQNQLAPGIPAGNWNGPAPGKL